MGRKQAVLDGLSSAHRSISGFYQHFGTAQVVYEAMVQISAACLQKEGIHWHLR